MKDKVLFALDRHTGPGWCQAGRSRMRWRGRSSPSAAGQASGKLNSSRASPREQRVHVLHPQAPGCMKSPHSLPWKGVPGGPNGYKLLYFSLSIPIMIIFISACSHNNSGLCLTKVVLNCMSSCMCLPLHLRWAVALRFGLASEVFHSLNNMDAIQTPLKSIGILQLTHRP